MPTRRRCWRWRDVTGCRRCCRWPTTGDAPASLVETFRRDRLITTARNLLLAQVAEECAAALAADGHRARVAQGAGLQRDHLSGRRRATDQRRRSAGSGQRPARGLRGARQARLRTARGRARFRRRRLSRGRVDAERRRGRSAPRARAAGALSHRLPASCGRTFARSAIGRRARRRRCIPQHAAIFHALHMAIDHFDVPGAVSGRLQPPACRRSDERDRGGGAGARLGLLASVRDRRRADGGLSARLGRGATAAGRRRVSRTGGSSTTVTAAQRIPRPRAAAFVS